MEKTRSTDLQGKHYVIQRLQLLQLFAHGDLGGDTDQGFHAYVAGGTAAGGGDLDLYGAKLIGQLCRHLLHGIHGVQDMCNLLVRNKKQFFIEAGHYKESDVIERVINRVKGIKIAN